MLALGTRAAAAAAGLVAVAACGSSGRDTDERTTAVCAQPAAKRRPFRDTVADKLGRPRHVAGDAVVAVGSPAVVAGKFHYGKLGKDLEEETVALFIGDTDCGPWRAVGERDTDDDGRVRFEIPAFDAPAAAELRFVVLGDGTTASGRLFAVAPDTPAVLFDIDGTLTEDDAELLEDLAGGTADARPGAADVARHWAGRGRLVVYITGRPYRLRDATAQWLAAHEFPDGPVFATDRWRDALPSSSKVGAFKRAEVEALIAGGLSFEAAYGNASTDVCAYAEAGIPPSQTWIIGDELAPTCAGHDPAYGFASYVEHLGTLRER